MKFKVYLCWYWLTVWLFFALWVPMLFLSCLVINLCQLSWWMAKDICEAWGKQEL